jgi:hypothetical protein
VYSVAPLEDLVEVLEFRLQAVAAGRTATTRRLKPGLQRLVHRC